MKKLFKKILKIVDWHCRYIVALIIFERLK